MTRILLCVVEQPFDIVTIERTREYRGLYHVLGGALQPSRRRGPRRPAHRGAGGRGVDGEVEEVILATNPTMTGEATAMYVADLLPGSVRATGWQAACR